MPRIFLKPNSPEFEDERMTQRSHVCEMPGCAEEAEHKAPKHRGLNEYHYFCMEHVREYNKAWNFFEGMSNHEVEEHMLSALYGDRPTWRYTSDTTADDILRRKAWQTYHNTDEEPPKNGQKTYGSYQEYVNQHSPEHEAMAIMGLEPPLNLPDIRKRYKDLAKKHHPDVNNNCKKSEEMLKKINMAYTILKVAYEKYEELPERK